MKDYLQKREAISKQAPEEKQAKMASCGAGGFESMSLSSVHSQSAHEGMVSIAHNDEYPDGPNVQLLKEDGKITKISITCTCGKVLELECHYQTSNN